MIYQTTKLALSGGAKLAAYLYPAAKTAHATLVIVHGLGEHAQRYQDLSKWFQSKGIQVLSFDQWGHGKSPGKRGHANFKILQESVAVAIEYIKKNSEAPVFLYGHSFGGNVAITSLLESTELAFKIDGLILSAPWINLAVKVPVYIQKAAKILAAIYPSYTQRNRLMPAWLSRDEKVGNEYLADPLVHDSISIGLYYEAVKAAEKINVVGSLAVPLLIMHGTDDKIISLTGSANLNARLSSPSHLKLWSQLRHELHQEPEKRELYSYVHNWIEELIRLKIA